MWYLIVSIPDICCLSYFHQNYTVYAYSIALYNIYKISTIPQTVYDSDVVKFEIDEGISRYFGKNSYTRTNTVYTMLILQRIS